jgi:hypothetical protein
MNDKKPPPNRKLPEGNDIFGFGFPPKPKNYYSESNPDPWAKIKAQEKIIRRVRNGRGK